MTCTPQQCYIGDGEISIVCNCTAACNEIINWWDNDTTIFCHDTKINASINDRHWNSNQSHVVTGVIEPTECDSSGHFTSHLTYSTSVSMESSTYIQIGCFIMPDAPQNSTTPPFPTNESCSPGREPMDSERNFNTTWHINNCTGSVYYFLYQLCNIYGHSNMFALERGSGSRFKKES